MGMGRKNYARWKGKNIPFMLKYEL